MQKSPMSSNGLIRFTTYFAIIISLIILMIKVYGYSKTHSSSLLASLTDSFSDVLMSFGNFVAAIYAMQPPDNEHRFGHGKAEDLASFFQSILLFIVSLFIIYTAIIDFSDEKSLHNHSDGLKALFGSTFLLLILIIVQKYAIARTGSKIIKVDNLHYLTDVIMNLAVICAIYINGYSDFEMAKYADSVVAILIGIYIIYSISRVAVESFKNLMDHEFSDQEKAVIIEIFTNCPHIDGFHDLKTRISGQNYFVQAHIEMDGNMTLNQCHEITDKLEKDIASQFKNCNVIIHQDPKGAHEEVEFEGIKKDI